MNTKFAGRDFGKSDVEGYQLRIPREQITIREGWTREELLVDPNCHCPLSSNGVMWPSVLAYDDEREVVDPVIGLIPPWNLPLALCALDARVCELVFLRLIGLMSIRDREDGRGEINVTTPPGFEFCGFEVTNGWYGLSAIGTGGHNTEDWKELRSLASGHVNEWNLLTDFTVAHKVANLCSERDPTHGPFRAVLFATAKLETRLRIAADVETMHP